MMMVSYIKYDTKAVYNSTFRKNRSFFTLSRNSDEPRSGERKWGTEKNAQNKKS